MFTNCKALGRGLWSVEQVFDWVTYRALRRCYRETTTGWQCLSPNRIMSLPNNPDLSLLRQAAMDMCPFISSLTGMDLNPHDQAVFLDLPGHQLSWHFDSVDYKVLVQVYCGDIAQPDMGTRWYIGDQNDRLLETHGTNSIVNVDGLKISETVYTPNSGYINDNTQKKAHGTQKVRVGSIRESMLFTFR